MLAVLFIGGAGFLLLVKESSDRKILELAYLDHLTGLLNRRHFTEEALTSFERHGRYNETMAILFLDLDHFKMINDTYGHPFGDEVLRDFCVAHQKKPTFERPVVPLGRRGVYNPSLEYDPASFARRGPASAAFLDEIAVSAASRVFLYRKHWAALRGSARRPRRYARGFHRESRSCDVPREGKRKKLRDRV